MLRSISILLCLAAPICAQGTKADYDRALSLPQRTANKVFRTRVEPHWIGGGDSFWYRVEVAPGKFENVLVDCLTGERKAGYEPAGDEKQALKPLERPRPSRDGGPETSVVFVNKTAAEVRVVWIAADRSRKPYQTIKPGERHAQHTFAGHVWAIESGQGKTIAVFEAGEGDGEAVIEESRSPIVDGPAKQDTQGDARVSNGAAGQEWNPFIRDNNVWLRHRNTKVEVQLSKDGKAGDSYREPLISPDGQRLLACRVTPEQEHTVTFVESSPKDQIEPKVHQQQYLKPGDRVRRERPFLFDLEKREAIAIDDKLFPNPWDLSDFRWEPDSSRVTFVYNQRGHQVMRVIAVDARTGVASTLVEETSNTFIDYSQKEWHRWLDKTGELLWASERNGWNHIYLFDARSGTLKNPVTQGNWVARSVELVDEEKRQLWLRVAGVYAGQDPYYVHLARVNFDGSDFKLLTEGDGTRVGTGRMQRSPNGKWLVDSYSRVDMAPVAELRNAETGAFVCTLERADASALTAAGWTMPERFVAKGRDGSTNIYGVIYRPSNFDPAKKYPVLEEIYAGPHGYFVPKEWGRQVRQHALAELGFIVVQIDGMGTNWRSRAFHDVAWRNLKDSGFPDRIAWMQAAASTRPWMDLTRVGIYGGSAGGQSALAGLLHHGDFYKAGVADCGCHDNRMDKIWWNEAWLGEVGPWYAENSNVTHAAKLRGKLMLTVGEMDRNVDPASTMQVVNALIKADKDFDLIVVPGAGHGIGESPYMSRRRMDFFTRHLLGVEPRQ